MKVVRQIALLVLMLVCILCPLVTVAQRITSVQVNVQDVTGRTSVELREKMAESMLVVSQQLLIDRSCERIANQSLSYERLLTEVAERALTGYSVRSLTLQPSEKTNIEIQVEPWSSAVDEVLVKVQFSGVSERVSSIILKDAPDLGAKVRSVVKGASVDALDWTYGIVRRTVRDYMAQYLPEFKAMVDLSKQGTQATAHIVIYPVGQVAQNIQIDMMSENLPNVLFRSVQEEFRLEADALRGLPLAYVAKHKEELAKLHQGKLSSYHEVKLYGAKPKVVLTVAPTVHLKAQLDSPRYKVWFEGYADLGRGERNISGKAHLGRYTSRNDEFFAETSVEFNDTRWSLAAGYMRTLGDVSLGVVRNFTRHENNYRFEYNFAPKWRLRVERFTGQGVNEIALRYRVHEFLSLEYVYSTDKPYFRLIGNL